MRTYFAACCLLVACSAAVADGAPATRIVNVRIPDSASNDAKCDAPPSTATLYGAGSIEIDVAPAEYDAAQQYALAASGDRRLIYINGKDLTDALSPTETIARDPSCVRLRYQLLAGDSTQNLWESIYHQKNLTDPVSVPVALGWKSTGPNSLAVDGKNNFKATSVNVAVSSIGWVAAAAIAVVVLLLFLYWLGRTTNVFRDRAPAWLQLACNFQKRFQAAADDDGRVALLRQVSAVYIAGNEGRYLTHATNACKALVDPLSPSDEEIAVGMLLAFSGKPMPRPTWSLSRLQLAIWFAFAICAAIFIWLVHGALPALSGSLLGILGITVGVSSASMAISSDAEEASTGVSKNLLSDLVTGFDDKTHVHRYQAVVVNLMLLAAGLLGVVQTLQLPTFDSTWLAFLGLSGAASAAGKQMLEGGK